MVLYRDFDISFLNDPLTGDLAIVEDEASVSQSVRSLIMTSLFERPFQPSLGSIVNQLLFAPNDNIMQLVLAKTIQSTVDEFEPRAKVKTIDFYTKIGPNREVLDNNTLIVTITFAIHNMPSLVSTNVVLRRLR